VAIHREGWGKMTQKEQTVAMGRRCPLKKGKLGEGRGGNGDEVTTGQVIYIAPRQGNSKDLTERLRRQRPCVRHTGIGILLCRTCLVEGRPKALC